jgi:hypothetical protein
MTDLNALLDRVDALKAGNRKVDAEIAFAFGWKHVNEPVSPQPNTISCWYDPDGVEQFLPTFTGSFDAAVALVERVFPDEQWKVVKVVQTKLKRRSYRATFLHSRLMPWDHVPLYGRTPAMALLRALFHAKLAKPTSTSTTPKPPKSPPPTQP